MGHAVSVMESGQPVSNRIEAGTIIRGFLRWTLTAPAGARAEGAAALAMAYLRRDLDARDRQDALSALTALLDDGSPLVRMALARVLATSADAPHHLVTALANDRSEIAAVVLGGSPVLTDAELVDAVAVGDEIVQSAVARRLLVSVGVSAALAEVGALPAGVALAANRGAELARDSLARLIERFGDDADLREAILARPGLDTGLRHDLVVATARALTSFVTARGWMSVDGASRVSREAADQACVTIAVETAVRDGASGRCRLVAHLRQAGRLTPALILRALLCGNLAFFEAAVSELSGVPLTRVAGLARGGRTLGFGALYAKAGLPPSLLPAFRAAILSDPAAPTTTGECGVTLQRRRIGRVLQACAGSNVGDLGRVEALLRRFDAEAAREDARVFALEVRRDPRDGGKSILPRLSLEDRGVPLLSAA